MLPRNTRAALISFQDSVVRGFDRGFRMNPLLPRPVPSMIPSVSRPSSFFFGSEDQNSLFDLVVEDGAATRSEAHWETTAVPKKKTSAQ